MSQTIVTYESFDDEELESLVKNIYNFTELLCFQPPATGFYDYQELFVKAIITDVLLSLGNSLTGLFARQSGKSESVANVAAALMIILPKLANYKGEDHRFLYPQLRSFASGYKVGIFAPSGLQATTTYARLRERLTSPNGRMFLDSPEFALEGHQTLLPFVSNKSDYLAFNNGSFCRQLSADKSSKIESQTFHLILLDESQDLDSYIVGKSISPMGASTNATTVATGTPGITKGYFYNIIANNKREEILKRPDKKQQPQLHFEYDYKVVQKSNANYTKYVKKKKKELGEDSDEFQQAYCLVWLLERGMAVPEALFEELTIKSLNITTSWTNDELVAGLDWGKSQDSTVLTIGKPIWDRVDESGRAPVEVLYWWNKLGDNYEEIFAELQSELKRFNVRTLACDATGTGEPLADRLIWELPHITILPVKFSSQSKDHLYKWFLLMLQERKVWWPGLSEVRKRKYWKMFEDQMLNLVKEYKGQFLACHAPEDQKNAHDDFPDSLALMLWCINEEAMPFIQVSDAPAAMYETHNWQKDPKGFSLR